MPCFMQLVGDRGNADIPVLQIIPEGQDISQVSSAYIALLIWLLVFITNWLPGRTIVVRRSLTDTDRT